MILHISWEIIAVVIMDFLQELSEDYLRRLLEDTVKSI
jgi:hypothetical protein